MSAGHAWYSSGRALHACLFALLLAMAANAYSTDGETFLLDRDFSSLTAASIHARVLRDPEHLDLAQLRTRNDLPWQAAAARVAAGFTTDTLWMRLALRRTENGPASVRVEIANPLLDELDVYVVDDDGVAVSWPLGDTRPAANRPLPWRNFLVPVDLSAEHDTTIYLRARSHGNMTMPVVVWSQQAFFAHEQRELITRAALYGSLLGAIFMFVLVARGTGTRGVYSSALFLLGLVLYLAHIDGVAGQYLPIPGRWWNECDIALLTLLLLVIATWFSAGFLRLAMHMPRARIPTCVLLLLFAAVLPAGLALGYYRLLPLIAGLAPAYGALAVALGLYCQYRKVPRADVYVVVMTFFTIGLAASNLERLGLLPVGTGPQEIVAACIFLQALALAWLLTARIRQDRRDHARAQEQLLANRKRAVAAGWHLTYEFEREVERQTEALSQTMQELRQVNHKLADLSRHDGLTGLHNRRHFNERYPELLQLAARRQQPVAVVMIDIDHFKDLNDGHGHVAGDECLRQVAAALRHVFARKTDLLARYGGEEFVVVLPDTTPELALATASRARDAVAALQIDCDGRPLRVTASFGVASGVPGTSGHEEFLAAADAALYRAKHRGRNRVEH